MEKDIRLYVGGQIWHGWQQTTVTLSLDSIFGQAELGLSANFDDKGTYHPLGIKGGADCRLTLNGELVIAGYVNKRPVKIGPDGFDLDISLRDKAALLFKGSILNISEWQKQKLDRIVKDICQPFGIQVIVQADVGQPFEKFKVNTGETANSAIGRLCKQRGLFYFADNNGNLVLTKAGQGGRAAQSLVFGDGNVYSASYDLDLSNRHSHYVVKNQTSRNKVSWNGSGNNSILAQAQDKGVPQYSPKVIIPEEDGGENDAGQLALTTANIAKAKSEKITYSVKGWDMASGAGLWKLNQLVQVQDNILGRKAEMLIKRLVFSVDEDSAPWTDITLVDRDAYELIAAPAKEIGGFA